MGRVRTLLATTWAVFGISLLVIFGVDLLLRVALPDGREHDRAVDTHRADAFEGSHFMEPLLREYHDSKEMMWTPYLYWRRPHFEGEHVRVDADGRRHTWSPPDGGGAPRVFVFGGSTTWGAGARNEFTIPSLLAKQMHEAGIAVRVSNFGESGYVNTQGVIALLLELRSGNVPDVAVFYDGANDLFAALQAGRAGDPQNEDSRRREFNSSKRRTKLALLVLQRTFVGIDRLASSLRTSDAEAGAQAGTQALASETLALYARNLQIVEALSERFGFATLYYWQPSVFSKAPRTAYEDSLVALRPERERELFRHAAALAARSGELAAIEGFADLSNVFSDTPDPLFFDFIHLSEAGNALIASAMTSDLSAALR